MDDHTSMLSVIPAPSRPAAQRQRKDLKLWRVLIALGLAPLLGAAVMTWGINFLNGIFAEDQHRLDARDLALMLFSPSLWSLVTGGAYLQTVTRIREQIARYECLLLGCGSGFLLPVALATGSELMFHPGLPRMAWSDIGSYSIAGLLTLPFGLFGGWVFWRFGVRPAVAPTTDVAAVFD